MTSIDQSTIMETILNPGSVNGIRQEEKELSYKQSLKRDWEKAFAEQSHNEHIDYENDEAAQEQANHTVHMLENTQKQAQPISDHQTQAHQFNMQNALGVAAISSYAQNNQHYIQLVAEKITNSFAELQSQVQVLDKNVKFSVTSTEESAPVTSKGTSSSAMPTEYNVHVAYEADRVKIWLRQTNLSESEGMEIFKQLQNFFKEKGLKIVSFHLNGTELISEQQNAHAKKSIDIDRKINQVL